MSNDERELCSDRLELALEMFEFGLDVKRCQFRRNEPTLGEDEIDRLVVEWLVDRPIIE